MGLEERAGQSLQRETEATKIIKILEELVKKNPGRKLDVGIISFYKGQVDLIRDKLKDSFPDNVFANKFDEMCNTVDSYQGKEFDIVIISGVRSNSYSTAVKSLGFIHNSPSRINVALSRAKKLLVMVGDVDTYRKNEYFQKFIYYVKKEGFYE
jgi:superfamily I DNA and/or RNA helicase